MIKFTLTLQVNGIFGLNHYITGGWACLFIFSVRIQELLIEAQGAAAAPQNLT